MRNSESGIRDAERETQSTARAEAGDADSLPRVDDPLDMDLPCPACGYNLRGLPSDPIRCPECGASYARAEVRLAVLEHALRSFAEPPLGAASLAWATMICGAISLSVGSARSLFHPLTMASVMALAAAVIRFRRQVRARPGWWIALLAYVFALIVAPLSAVGGIVSGFGVIVAGFVEAYALIELVALFCFCLVLLLMSLAAYHSAVARMRQMVQAEMIEAMARLGIVSGGE